MFDVIQKVVGDFGNRNIVDIQFISFDEEQKEVKRAIKKRQVYFKVFLCHSNIRRTKLNLQPKIIRDFGIYLKDAEMEPNRGKTGGVRTENTRAEGLPV
jgi:hypothetical protein